MLEGIAYIISNSPDKKHKNVFEELCNKSILFARQHLKLPIAILCLGDKCNVKADHIIDGTKYLEKHLKPGEETHGLIAAELLKTYIAEWSPFDRTLYLDCDAFIMKPAAKDYIDVLSYGYDLSLSTCITMEWKDSIEKTAVKDGIFKDVPSYFPYWNFGIFGSHKGSGPILDKIREEFLTYCFGGWSKFGSVPHAQPAVVRAAFGLAPNHKIFTMPAKYNCHFAGAGGYVFSGSPIILHLWKDIREMMLR